VGITKDSAWSSGMSRRSRMSNRTSSGSCSICGSSFIGGYQVCLLIEGSLVEVLVIWLMLGLTVCCV
jgi:hypothetical protein